MLETRLQRECKPRGCFDLGSSDCMDTVWE